MSKELKKEDIIKILQTWTSDNMRFDLSKEEIKKIHKITIKKNKLIVVLKLTKTSFEKSTYQLKVVTKNKKESLQIAENIMIEYKEKNNSYIVEDTEKEAKLHYYERECDLSDQEIFFNKTPLKLKKKSLRGKKI